MAEQIKFGDNLYLQGEKLVLDNGASAGVISSENGTVKIEGNLTVTGTTTTVNSETVTFADSTLLLNSNETGTPSEDGGIEIERGTATNKLLTWSESSDKWTVGAETFVAGTFEGNLTGNSTGLHIGGLQTNGQDLISTGLSELNDVRIWSGSINDTTIGAITPTSGTFSTITGDGTAITNVLANYTTTNLTEGTNKYFTDERVDDRIDSLFTNAYGISGTYNDAGDVYTLAFDPINAGSAIAVLDTTDTTQAKFRTIREGQVGTGGNGDLTVALSGDEIVIDTAIPINHVAYNSYTGNGSVSIYTLPYSVSQDWQVLVYIDGEVQHPTINYSISGTTLTLTSPLGNSAVMNVVRMATNSVSSSITDANTLGGNLPNHYLSWAQTTGTPTTLAGYGITDAKIIPFYYANQAAFPNASTNHGAIAHSHSDGAMYFAHGGIWNKLANNATTLSGYGITDGYANSDVDAHLNQSNPISGYVLSWNGSDYTWIDNAGYTDSDFDTRFATKSTTDLAEGTNLYYTDARSRASISVSGDLSYNSSTGVISSSGLASSTTDDLAEGSSNLYYTNARADARAQAVSINNVVEDTTPQLGGTLDLNTFDLTTLDDTVTLTTNATASIVTGTVASSTETLLSNTTITVNDEAGNVANATSAYMTLTSTEIDNLGFQGNSSLEYFGSAASSSNFVFRDTGDSVEQNSMVIVYSPPTDTYTFTLAYQHADTDAGTPGNQNQLNVTSADSDIKFKQYAYGEMTISSLTALSNSNIQLRDANGFYIDKSHVDVTNTSGNNYKIVFWTHSVGVGDTIDVVHPASSPAIFTWGAENYNETGLVASSESFSISSSSNDIIAIGDLDFTSGNVTGEVVGTLIYDNPSTKSIVSGLATVSIDGTDYQSALTVTDVPLILSGNSGTANEVSLAVGTGADGRIHQLGSSGITTFKFPAADGTANQVMKTDGSGDISWTTQSTDYVTEGSNLYYTNARARSSISASGDIAYNSSTGVISSTGGLASSTTDDLAEGSTNLYYTAARDTAQFNTDLATKDTDDLAEGTNLYYTDARADTRAQLKIDALVDSSPGTLDTLNELAAALGDDANFATTMTTSLAGKEPTITAGTTSQYWRGDKSFQTLDTLAVAENTNLYYTDARARSSISTSGDISYNSSTGVISTTGLASSDTDDLSEGTTNLYYTDARVDSYINSSITTDDVGEGANLYYTDARVQAVSINDIVEDTTPQLGGNLDLNTYDLSTTDPTVSLTTTLTATTAQGTVGASSETNTSTSAVTINTDNSDVANAVSSYATLTSTQITNLGFEGDVSLTYFGAAAPTSNFVFRDIGDSAEQNNMIIVYSPPADTYTFTLPTNVSLPTTTGNQTPFNSDDADIYFKQYAYGEMTVTSASVLSSATIQLRDSNGFYIDKEHVTVTSLGGTSYKVVFWTHDVGVGDVIDVIAASAQTALFEWGTESFSKPGFVLTSEGFSVTSSTNDIFALGDLQITTGSVTGEVVGTAVYDSPTGSSIISGLTTVTIDGAGYQSALTVSEVPIIMTGNADTGNELSLAVGSGTDARLWLLNNSGSLIYKFPAADGTANQVMKTDGSGDLVWANDNDTTYTAGTDMSLVGTVFNNTAPDQTVSLTGTGATTVTGTYPNFTISSTDTNTTTSVDGNIIPATDNTYDLGSTSKKYANIYGHSVHAHYADLAERYASDVPYDEGTVVVLGGDEEITVTSEARDVAVAGVISTNPGLKMNADAGDDTTHPYVALRGRVPCKMIGPVSKGDLIVTADNEPGYAQSVGKENAGRSVFAKSIETDLTEGKKLIEVVIL